MNGLLGVLVVILLIILIPKIFFAGLFALFIFAWLIFWLRPHNNWKD